METIRGIDVTVIGGPTARIRIGNVVLLTDPTFDPASGDYPSGSIVLHKTSGPALSIDEVGPVDVVLLSHDQHWDNLDRSGRGLLDRVPLVLTTTLGASRLGGTSQGLEPWQSVDVGDLRITATPARHGPAGYENLAGPVVGFVVSDRATGRDLVYVTGDTCWFDGVAEVARRFDPDVVLAFAGAAAPRGPFHLTMDSNDVLETAAHFPGATVVPLHHEGWSHFTQSDDDLGIAFAAVGRTAQRLSVAPGVETEVHRYSSAASLKRA
jgi:L-ascorbate metabolism protein UlaG (beta-lactamase superfamily)